MELWLFDNIDEAANEKDFLNIKEASEWASKFTGKNVTASNISYLI